MTERDIKHALDFYHELRKDLKRVEDKLDALNAKRFKAGGSIVRIPENAEPIDHRITTNLMKLDALTKDRERYAYYVALGEDFIGKCGKYRALVEDKYIHGFGNNELEKRHNFGKSEIYRIVDKLITGYVNAA